MYDAKAGRFLGRDPIGYDGASTLYANLFAICLLDPNGQTTVIVNPKRNKSIPKECGITAYFQWDFVLDTKGDASPPCQNGYEGYIVQEVTQVCCKTDCDICADCEEKSDEGCEEVRYLEAWETKRSGKLGDIAYTDRAAAEITDKTCGSVSQSGLIKFFCKERIDLSGWHPGASQTSEPVFYGTKCPVTPLSLPSIDAKDPLAAFFWRLRSDAGQSRVPDASRDFNVKWNCCDPKKPEVDYNISPQ